jgi:hypothetical protein
MSLPQNATAGIELTLDDGVTLADLAARMNLPLPPPVETGPGFPAPIVTSEAFLAAMRSLPSLFGSVNPPAGGHSTLSEDEITQLTQEYEALDTVTGMLAERQEAIKDIIRVHKDAGAPATATERDAHGHVILSAPQQPHQTPVRALGKSWNQQYVSGRISFAGPGELARLHEEGALDRETYLGITREVRTFDQDKARLFFRKNPGALQAVLRIIASRGRPGTSLFLRKLKRGA